MKQVKQVLTVKQVHSCINLSSLCLPPLLSSAALQIQDDVWHIPGLQALKNELFPKQFLNIAFPERTLLLVCSPQLLAEGVPENCLGCSGFFR